jgi:hypothetical protein
MNEKIKQLAEQAKIDYDLRPEIARAPVWIALDDELEKFAKLIVRECVGILEPKSRYMGEGPEVLKDKIKQIKEHFGVEE